MSLKISVSLLAHGVWDSLGTHNGHNLKGSRELGASWTTLGLINPVYIFMYCILMLVIRRI